MVRALDDYARNHRDRGVLLMPYNSTSELPARIKKMPAKKRRQWMHVFNSTYSRTKDEGRAFAAANSVVSGKEVDDDMSRVQGASIAGGNKSVQVTMYTGCDDPDLPDHVAAMPMGLRQRWVNNYNWQVTDLKDDEAAVEWADEYTSMSVADLLEMGMLKEGPVDDEAPPPVSRPSRPSQPRQPAPSTVPGVLDKVLSVFKGQRAPSDKSTPAPRLTVFDVYKSADGGPMRALMVYSNMFEDKHKQIIREAAHKEYEQWVESKEGVYPEFHIWHGGPATRWGQADHIAYVDGFAVAGGVVDPGKEHVALKLKEEADRGELAVSHGFVGLLAPDDTYLAYRSFEISPLPIPYESNPWTSIDLSLKENGMPFHEKKKSYFKALGMSDEAIVDAEKKFEAMTASLKAAGVEYREAGETQPPAPPDPPPTPPPAPPQPQPPQPGPTPPPAQAAGDATLLNTVVAMQEAMTGLASTVAALKSTIETANTTTTQAAAENMVLGRIAAGMAGGGHSPTRAPSNLVGGVKEEEDDFLGGALAGVLGSDFVQAASGRGGGGGVVVVPPTPPVPAQ